jgi:hypothetical protein
VIWFWVDVKQDTPSGSGKIDETVPIVASDDRRSARSSLGAGRIHAYWTKSRTQVCPMVFAPDMHFSTTGRYTFSKALGSALSSDGIQVFCLLRDLEFCGAIWSRNSALLLGGSMATLAIDHAATMPGRYGTPAAFVAEPVMAVVQTGIVLWNTNTARTVNPSLTIIANALEIRHGINQSIFFAGRNPARHSPRVIGAHLLISFQIKPD